MKYHSQKQTFVINFFFCTTVQGFLPLWWGPSPHTVQAVRIQQDTICSIYRHAYLSPTICCLYSLSTSLGNEQSYITLPAQAHPQETLDIAVPNISPLSGTYLFFPLLFKSLITNLMALLPRTKQERGNYLVISHILKEVLNTMKV